MLYYQKNAEQIRKNAQFILKTLGECVAGENVIFICDCKSRNNALSLADVSRELELNPLVIDIDCFGRDERYLNLPVMEPLRAAIFASDAAFMLTDQMLTDFGRFLGDDDATDLSLLGKNRRYTLEANGLDEWGIDEERVLRDRERTLHLQQMLSRGGELHITTERGTDFRCDLSSGVERSYPVMAIIPFYVEVAVIPKAGAVTGKLVVDGASQCAYAQRGFPIRPAFPGNQEICMEPLSITLDHGKVTGFSGPAIQCERLEKWMYSSQPNADQADEIGLVTCTSPENDRFGWLIDGTHQTHCVHVALGNNVSRRSEIIHAPEHCDFDMHDPKIEINGKVIYEKRSFNDELIFRF